MRTAARPGIPASPPRRSRIGDIRMRDIYRGLAVVAALAVVAVGVTLVLPSEPDETGTRPVAAPSAAPVSSGPVSSGPVSPSSPLASGSATPEPTVKQAAVAGDEEPVPASASSTPRPTPTPGTSLAPGYTAMEALYADARVPRLPAKLKRVTLPKAGKSVIKDKRTRLAVPDLPKPWKSYGPAPFTTRQVLPKPRTGPRGMLVSCPVPIEVQKNHRDTALLAARWTLNHHPEGSEIRWLGSQRIKNGWTLLYEVEYGKRRSRAAVMVVDSGMSKPALVFISVPDTQRNRWRDIPKVIAGVRVLR